MNSPARTASCSCGQLRVQVKGEPLVGICHCLARQKRTGTFGDSTSWAPRVSVYDCRRHPWVQLPPGTVTFERDPA